MTEDEGKGLFVSHLPPRVRKRRKYLKKTGFEGVEARIIPLVTKARLYTPLRVSCATETCERHGNLHALGNGFAPLRNFIFPATALLSTLLRPRAEHLYFAASCSVSWG